MFIVIMSIIVLHNKVVFVMKFLTLFNCSGNTLISVPIRVLLIFCVSLVKDKG